MDEAHHIVSIEDVPADGTVLFSVENGDGVTEAILLELADGVVAFENRCPHWQDVRLDAGDGATVRAGEIVCEKHGATFETDSGYCTFGPCEGATLPELDVDVEDGEAYLTEEGYTVVGLGPSEDGDDDGDPGGRSGGGRIGFGGV